MGALRREVRHDDDSRRWGSAYGFTLEHTEPTSFMGRIGADCRAPAPSAAPFPGLSKANPQTKANILVCVAQWRVFFGAYLLLLVAARQVIPIS
jgi:hypothetical protein